MVSCAVSGSTADRWEGIPLLSGRPFSPLRERGWVRVFHEREPANFWLLADLMSGAHQVDIGPSLDLRRFDLEIDQLGHPVVIDRSASAVA